MYTVIDHTYLRFIVYSGVVTPYSLPLDSTKYIFSTGFPEAKPLIFQHWHRYTSSMSRWKQVALPKQDGQLGNGGVQRSTRVEILVSDLKQNILGVK